LGRARKLDSLFLSASSGKRGGISAEYDTARCDWVKLATKQGIEGEIG
jgi:hypothetical protein